MWNNFKTLLLMTGLMGLCLAIGYLIGGPRTMFMFLIFGALSNFFMYFFSDKIVIAMMGAKQIQRNDDPVLWDMVERLTKRSLMPMPKVYISPEQAPNAFATGRNPSHAAVCVTAGLRRMLSENELAGVIAHELGHVRNRDILITTIASVIAGAIMFAARMAFWFGGSRDDDDRGNPLLALLLFILAPIAAMLIQMAISRSREYQADKSGAEMCGEPMSLARALEKISSANQVIPLPVSNAQASLFIVQPLTGQELASLFMTHPPVAKRIERLKAMQGKIS